MNTKITFLFTTNRDDSIPNNNYSEQKDDVIVDSGFTFSEYLNDCAGLKFEEENGEYFILDDEENRTGEAYMVLREEETDEELRG